MSITDKCKEKTSLSLSFFIHTSFKKVKHNLESCIFVKGLVYLALATLESFNSLGNTLPIFTVVKENIGTLTT